MAALIVFLSRLGMFNSFMTFVLICSLILFLSSSFWMNSLILRLIVEFQWFLMALSVLPGKNFAMIAHLFPRLGY
jgi:hypothetical protein